MLTKDLLKYSTRGDKIYPKYIKPSEANFLSIAKNLEDRFVQATGRAYRELNDEIRQHPQANDIVYQGLCKLIEDRCEFLDPEESREEQRWKWMIAAQQLRQSDFEDYPSFQTALAQQMNLDFSVLEEELYGDLGENRSLKSVRPLGAEGLLHRYNLAQIQGLLVRAQSVKIRVKSPDIVSRRRLLQKLRFCRLLAEFTDELEQGSLTLNISGPLAIFEQAQGYGLRLCQFFPYALLFDNWELEAEVRLGDKRMTLVVDNSKPIRSHYQGFAGYIPEELKEFMQKFNQLGESDRGNWLVEEGQENINLGKQNYCVPDLTFIHKSGSRHHMELFHRWHQKELSTRIQGLNESSPSVSLGLGVAKELLKDKTIEEKLAQFRQGNISIFTFGQFPTVKAILTYLAKVKVESGVL